MKSKITDKLTHEIERIGKLGMWELDIATGAVIWSEALYHMLGLDPNKPPPNYAEHEKLFTPESWSRLQDSVAATSSLGTPYEIELKAILPDGTRRWMLARGEAVRDQNGDIVKLRGASFDITSSKNTEVQLLNIIEAAPNGFLLIDENGIINLVNTQAELLFGYRRDELLGQPVEVLIPAPQAKLHPKHRADYSLDQRMRRMGIELDLFALHKSGRQVPVEVGLSTLTDDEGSLNILASIVDISVRKDSQEEKEHLQRQLNSTQKMDSIGRLAGGIAHDYNNVLTVILANAELLRMKLDSNSPLLKQVTQIEDAAQRSAELIKRILSFSRNQSMHAESIDLNAAILHMTEILSTLTGENITLDLKLGENLSKVVIDRSQVDQLITNLCINSRDAIKGKGRIEIHTANISTQSFKLNTLEVLPPGDYVRLALSDNGCGMDTDLVANIFEPFFTTKPLGQGTGLGLATVYGIVKQNKGSIHVASEKGVGTTFSIYFPIYNTPPISQSKLSWREGETDKSRCASILLVEDDPNILESVYEILNAAGHDVTTRQNPIAAIEVFKQSPDKFDLLITDVIMPEINGPELVNQLLAINPDLNFLLMSGYSADILSKLDVESVSSNFLSKPFKKADILDKISTILLLD